jgi:hypothetical protein
VPSSSPQLPPTGAGGAGGTITSTPALVGTDGSDVGPFPFPTPQGGPAQAVGGTGGAGGTAVKGDTNITWQTTGNRYGTIQPTV